MKEYPHLKWSVWGSALMGVVAVGLFVGSANAVLIYEHHFDDLTDITDDSAGGSISISSAQSVDPGGNSLFFDDVANGNADAKLFPAGGINDTTFTVIARYYTTHDDEDRAVLQVVAGTSRCAATGRDVGKAPGKLAHFDDAVPGWVGTDVDFPVNQWVTYGMVIDYDTRTWDLYFAPGTEVTTSDLKVSGIRLESSAPNGLQMYSAYVPDVNMYVDEIEIYSELGEGIEVVESHPGDADGDGRVDEEDAATLAAHWLSAGDWGDGDFNADDFVDDIDATIMAANWGYGVPEAVPEPGSLILLVIGCLVLFVRKITPW